MAVARVRRISHDVSSHRTSFFDYCATFDNYCTSFACYCTTLGIYCTSSHYRNEGFLPPQKTNLLDGGRHPEWLSHELGEYRTRLPLIARVRSEERRVGKEWRCVRTWFALNESGCEIRRGT